MDKWKIATIVLSCMILIGAVVVTWKIVIPVYNSNVYQQGAVAGQNALIQQIIQQGEVQIQIEGYTIVLRGGIVPNE